MTHNAMILSDLLKKSLPTLTLNKNKGVKRKPDK